jgi:hypothetical protein
METNAFASLAHLKIIIIPVGSISKPIFDKWLAVIRTFESIPLVDIPPARYDDRSELLRSRSIALLIHFILKLDSCLQPLLPATYTSITPLIRHRYGIIL